jgi:hypothetical protein
MLIPDAENAVVDIRKLRDYCLNLEHDDGKHKARLFCGYQKRDSIKFPVS